MVLPGHFLFLLGVSFGPRLQVYWLLSEESNTGDIQNTKWPRICIAAKWWVSTTAPAPSNAIILQGVVPRTLPPA